MQATPTYRCHAPETTVRRFPTECTPLLPGRSHHLYPSAIHVESVPEPVDGSSNCRFPAGFHAAREKLALPNSQEVTPELSPDSPYERPSGISLDSLMNSTRCDAGRHQ